MMMMCGAVVEDERFFPVVVWGIKAIYIN